MESKNQNQTQTLPNGSWHARCCLRPQVQNQGLARIWGVCMVGHQRHSGLQWPKLSLFV